MTQDPPDFVAARDHVVGQVVRFVRALRAGGAAVPANAALPATRALVVVGLADRERVRAALFATLVADPADGDVFDANFPAFWYRLRSGLEATATADDVGDRSGRTPGRSALPGESLDLPPPGSDGQTGVDGVDDADERDRAPVERARRIADRDPDPSTEGDREGTATYSARGEGAVVGNDVAATPALDPATVRRFVRALAAGPDRRWTPSGLGRRVDARRALRESVATGGVALTMPERGRAPTALRTSVLVDVSRSVLETVDRGFLLAFLAALVDAARSVRVFLFDTDIREVTAVFERSAGDPAAALARAEVAWGGGTRIGASLSTLRERWPGAVDRRTTTLVVSDGLDVGDVDELADGMRWLARRSRATLWLNPLAASPAYEPTCRGMAAARPSVDGLFAFAGPADLAEVARQLERHGARGPVGYEHDFRGPARYPAGRPTPTAPTRRRPPSTPRTPAHRTRASPSARGSYSWSSPTRGTAASPASPTGRRGTNRTRGPRRPGPSRTSRWRRGSTSRGRSGSRR